MKKITFVVALFLMATLLNAQTKSGTVYSEHENIDKTRVMWKSFNNGDAEAFISYFADSVYRITNGEMSHIPKENFKGAVNWWNSSFVNLKIQDHKPAYPDAIEYKKGGNWVQDWLLFSGTHEKTGINTEIHYHNLYRFNDEGKIDVIYFYYNNNVFEEIRNSQTTQENGKVYINHPFIVTVRKVLNAYMNKDIETWASYFSPRARFWYSTMNIDEWKTLKQVKERIVKGFENREYVKMEQVGYPDCIYYEKSNTYAVYSWWIYKEKRKDGTKINYPFMITHNFDKEGKIEGVFVYYSTNHLEKK